MKKVQVISAGGATLTGPMKLKLTAAQHARRRHVLGSKPAKNGIYQIDGGQSLSFKYGETLMVSDLPKLSKALFEQVGKGPVTAPEPGTQKGATKPADEASEAADGSQGADGPTSGADQPDG